MTAASFVASTMSIEELLAFESDRIQQGLYALLSNAFPKVEVTRGDYNYFIVNADASRIFTSTSFSVKNLGLLEIPAGQSIPVKYVSDLECMALDAKCLKIRTEDLKQAFAAIRMRVETHTADDFCLEIKFEENKALFKLIYRQNNTEWEFVTPGEIISNDSAKKYSISEDIYKRLRAGEALSQNNSLFVYNDFAEGVFELELPTLDTNIWRKVLGVSSIIELNGDVDMGALARRGLKVKLAETAEKVETNTSSEAVYIGVAAPETLTQETTTTITESLQTNTGEPVYNTETVVTEDPAPPKKRKGRRTMEQIKSDEIGEAKFILKKYGFTIDEASDQFTVFHPVTTTVTIADLGKALNTYHKASLKPMLDSLVSSKKLDAITLDYILSILTEILTDVTKYVSKTNIPALTAVK